MRRPEPKTFDECMQTLEEVADNLAHLELVNKTLKFALALSVISNLCFIAARYFF